MFSFKWLFKNRKSNSNNASIVTNKMGPDKTNPINFSAPEKHISDMIDSAPFPIAVFSGQQMRVERANQSAIKIWGKGPDVIGKNFIEVLPEIGNQGFLAKMQEVFTTGNPYYDRNSLVNIEFEGVLETYYFNYSITPLVDEKGKIYGVMNTAADVTDLNLAKKQLEFSEENFRNMILQAPVAICLLRGPEFVIDIVNGAMLDIWGKPYENVINKPVFQALAEAKEQGLEKIIENVYQTGESFFANELPVKLNRHGKQDTVYQNFVYQPYRDSFGAIVGVLALSVNVTDQVSSKLELERAYEQIQLSKKAAQLGTFDHDIENELVEWDERCRELFGVEHLKAINYENDFIGGIHPEDKKRILKVIKDLREDTNGKGNYDIEYRTIGQRDHRLRWIRAKGKMYYHNDRPKRFIGSVLDITSQKQTELRLAELAEKQSRLAAIVNSSDDIIISKTLEGIITSWNPAAERAFGYTEAEATGCRISLIIPKNRLGEEKFILEQIKAGNKIDHFQTIRKSKDNKEINLSLTVSPVFDIHGEVIGASKIARDISEQLRSQASAKRYTERLEIMNIIMTSVSEELDLNKILQKVIDATTELTGAQCGLFFYTTKDETKGLNRHFTIAGAAKEKFKDIVNLNNTLISPMFSQEVLLVEDITNESSLIKEQLSNLIPPLIPPILSYLLVPVKSRDGEVIGGLLLAHEQAVHFTEEHQTIVVSIAAQTAISLDNARLFEEVTALNDKKNEFIGLASHELKTPLASINGYLQILDRQIDEPQPKKFLSKALNQVTRITSLVNDLLDVSKIEAGKLQLTLGLFDLVSIISESIELIQHTQINHQLSFTTDKTACMIIGDAQRIEQVILNLLSNAIKYAPNAQKVDVNLHCTEEIVTIAVKDYGPGIAKDKLKNIFTRFYRIDESTPNISGLGIGLYLSNEIINRHQGQIWAESELGDGSTFYFSLPINKSIN